MAKRMFVDVNIIQTMPPNCANRDDTGSPKTCMYGGVRRARVSSQSWKNAMRTHFNRSLDESQLGVRTMKVVEMVSDKIIEIEPSIDRDRSVDMATKVIEAAGIKVKVKEKGGKKGTESKITTEVPVTAALFFLSNKQARNLAELAVRGNYEKGEVKTALNSGHGIDIALFGRMVADSPDLNTDASSQVAHAISTHRVENEFDFYTAVDDMASKESSGAGMMGTVEYNTSTMYRYATVSVHDLVTQFPDSDSVVVAVTEFIRAFVVSMPTGKQNTFANRTVPYAVFIALREDQPVSLAPAFEAPVSKGVDGGFNAPSVDRLVDYELRIIDDFVKPPMMTWQIGQGLDELGDSMNFDVALDSIAGKIRSEL